MKKLLLLLVFLVSVAVTNAQIDLDSGVGGSVSTSYITGDSLSYGLAKTDIIKSKDSTYINMQDDIDVDGSITSTGDINMISTKKLYFDSDKASPSYMFQDGGASGIVYIKPNGNNGLAVGDSYNISRTIRVFNDNLFDLGTTSLRWKDIYLSGSIYNGSTQLIDLSNSKIELKNTFVESQGTIADNDATPDVAGENIFTYSGSANSVTITDLDNPTAGAIYTIIGNSDTYLVTIQDGGNFNLSGGVDFVLGQYDTMVLYCVADNVYIEISRSDN